MYIYIYIYIYICILFIFMYLCILFNIMFNKDVYEANIREGDQHFRLTSQELLNNTDLDKELRLD